MVYYGKERESERENADQKLLEWMDFADCGEKSNLLRKTGYIEKTDDRR